MTKIIEILSNKIAQNSDKISAFFAKKFSENPALIYNSVDLRHAGFKIAPVDTNCFPAGFNNLCNFSKEEAKKIADNFLNKNFPAAKKILILPENHTRNLRYLNNVLNLSEILSYKREVVVGSLLEEITSETKIDLENGSSITLNPVKKVGDKIISSNNFAADLIVLNNDLTDGVPQILENISQALTPPTNMGWHKRTKSHHFDIYNSLAKEIAEIIAIDPWLISSLHHNCHDVDFKEQVGLECLAKYVDQTIEELTKKYQDYGINSKPYCYVKADNGTYGMAVWAVESGKDIVEINKKERNKMNMLKGSVQNTQVMIQEGIPTLDKIDDKFAEPMIYLIGGEVVGNLFRVNESRDEKISLNAAGASFFDLENLNDNQINLGATKNQIAPIYSLISRLAALAAAIENQQILQRND